MGLHDALWAEMSFSEMEMDGHLTETEAYGSWKGAVVICGHRDESGVLVAKYFCQQSIAKRQDQPLRVKVSGRASFMEQYLWQGQHPEDSTDSSRCPVGHSVHMSFRAVCLSDLHD